MALKSSASATAYFLGSRSGSPILSVDGKRLAVLGEGPSAPGSPGSSTRLLRFDVDAVLGGPLALRRKGRLNHLGLPRLTAGSTRQAGLAGPSGDYSIGFTAENGPVPHYDGSPPAVYVVGGRRGGFFGSRAWHGDPVDTASGAFSQSEVDLSPASGPAGAVLGRTYWSGGSASPSASL